MKANFIIRPFESCDQTNVRRLILEGLGEHFGCIDETLNPDLDDICANYIECNHPFFVVAVDDVLIGTGGLLVSTAEAQIVRVSVAAAYRRHGVGRQIVNHLIQTAATLKRSRIVVETTRTWDDVVLFYHRCGFRDYDCKDDELWMEMALVQE